MKAIRSLPSRIFSLTELVAQVNRWRMQDKKIVFTNGVFDILHEGHIASLCEAATFGDVLIVAVNSDTSVKKLKGEDRPVHNESTRTLILASLLMTDAVIIFEDDTPHRLITTLLPDVLVKGGDYTIDQVVGAKEVIAAGGEVKLAKIIDGVSTTNILDKIRTDN